MRVAKVALLVLMALVPLSVAPTQTQAQDRSRVERLASVDKAIVQAEAEANSGKKLMLVGVVGWAAGSAVLTSSPEASSALYLAGTVGWLWGGFKWWGARGDLSGLRAQRATLALAPLLDLRNPKAAKLGLSLRVTF